MRRFLLALSLLLAVAAGPARAALVYTFEPIHIMSGFVGPAQVTATWKVPGSIVGTPRDLTGATGSIVVFKQPPSFGVGGVILWSETITPVGTPSNVATFQVSSSDSATPGTYVCKIFINQSGITDAWESTCVIEGH